MLNSLYEVGNLIKQNKIEYDDSLEFPLIVMDIFNNSEIRTLTDKNSHATHRDILFYQEDQRGQRRSYAVLINVSNKDSSKKEEEIKKKVDKLVAFFEEDLPKIKTSIFTQDELIEFNKFKEVFGSQLENLNKKKEQIINLLSNYLSQYKESNSIYFTFLFDNKLIGSFNWAKKHYFFTKQEEFIYNADCLFCKQTKNNVAFKLPFLFTNMDKQGSIVGGFDKTQAWKNFPVCYECYDSIEKGKRYFFQSNIFSASFLGEKYFFIPKFLLSDSEKLINIVNEFKSITNKDISLADKFDFIKTRSEEVLNKISEQKDDILFDFIFIYLNTKEEKIIKYIQDVYPTRVKEIYDAFQKSKNLDLFNDKFICFNEIKKFFNININGKTTIDDYFYQMVRQIFFGDFIDWSRIFKRFYDFIRINYIKFNKGELSFSKFKNIVDTAVLFIYFLKTLYKEGEQVMTSIMTSNNLDEVLSSFFNKEPYLTLLDSSTKQGLYILGWLCKNIENLQYQKGIGNFSKYYKILRINDTKLNILTTKIFEYYKKYKCLSNVKRFLLNNAISLLKSDKNKLTTEEKGLYFVFGFTDYESLHKHLKSFNLINEENSEDNKDS